MNMKKPEMKIMRFVNEDVIATSGATPAAFELKGFFDGKSNNLETFVDGIKYNGGDALKAALDNKYSGNYNSLEFCYYINETRWYSTFKISRLNQGDSSYDSNTYSSGAVNVNGEYTYSGIDDGIIMFTKSTQ